MPSHTKQSIVKLHQEFGLKRLNPWWAKAENVIGLAATGIGLFAPDEMISHWSNRTLIFTRGLYFAMAGHRSHLYQSANRLIAHVVSTIEQ